MKGGNTRFKNGHTPWLKGHKGLTKGNKGSFQKGFVPWNKGKSGYKNPPLTQEAKNKISLARKGKAFSEDHRKKLSDAKKGKKSWNFGIGNRKLTLKIRDCEKYKEWRRLVFKNDTFSCRFCGAKSSKVNPIEADHIRPFSWIIKKYSINNLEQAISCEELWNVQNGRTLCKKCHMTTDTHGIKSLLYHE